MESSNSLYAGEEFGVLRDITIAEAVEALHFWIDEQAERAERGYSDALITLRYLDRQAYQEVEKRIEGVIAQSFFEYCHGETMKEVGR